MIVPVTEPARLAPLLPDWRQTMLWSYFAGRMGEGYADQAACPRSALVRVGDFCFFAGAPSAELAAFVPPALAHGFAVLAPQNALWAREIERAHPNAKRVTRYAFQKRDTFDRDALRRFAAAPAGFGLRRMDEALYETAKAAEWSRDLVCQYPSWADYAAHGRGFAATEGNTLVCGASSYADWPGGVEIEIDCRADRRRRGLARACAAALMLDCLKNGLHPSWDAANEISAHLADTLGYEPAGAYPAFEIEPAT
ncbi:MAG: GNAT family N-acetyltransferase [Eubacteriales bacterium]|nr:GNAT family N-acetyltransferase [Eubacteriales bacterium]